MQEDVQVWFCDLCGTSVPAVDLATGSAVAHQGKTVGACCLRVLRGGAAPALPGRPAGTGEMRILPAAIVLLAAVAAATIFLDQRLTTADDVHRKAIAQLAESQVDSSHVLAAMTVNLDGVPRRPDFDALAERVSGIAAAVDRALAEQKKQIDVLTGDLAGLTKEQRAQAGAAADYKPLMEDLRQRQIRILDLVGTLRAIAPVADKPPDPAAAPKPAEETPGPATPAAPALPAALAEAAKKLTSTDPAVRFEAADTLLRSKDAQVLPLVTPLARDADSFVRSLVVEGLRAWKRPEVVDALLPALGDTDVNVRDIAWRSLKEVTGQKLPFETNAGKDVRARAIQKWQEWWDKNKATFGS